MEEQPQSEIDLEAKRADNRKEIADRVIFISALVLVGVGFVGAIAILNNSVGGSDASLQLLNTLITAYVGLAGTWVGAVLAFYFSKDNFESAARESRFLFRAASEPKLESVAARGVMVAFKDIRGKLDVVINADKPLEGKDSVDVLFKDVSRLVFFEGEIVKAVAHKSTFYSALNKLKEKAVSSGDAGTGSPQVPLLLKDLFEVDSFKDEASKIVFLQENATLGSVKQSMEALDGCEDAFITPTGAAGEKPLGWVTDKIIERMSTV